MNEISNLNATLLVDSYDFHYLTNSSTCKI